MDHGSIFITQMNQINESIKAFICKTFHCSKEVKNWTITVFQTTFTSHASLLSLKIYLFPPFP